MNTAEANSIVEAMTGNQCLPSRYELKQMINRAEWETIGRLFQFTPVFLEGCSIDWRCVPKRVFEILQFKPDAPKGRVHPQVNQHAKHKAKPPKMNSAMGKRERTYCEQSAQCHYCGKYTPFQFWTVDHLTPVSRGGHNHDTNTVGACDNCNHAKGPLTFGEFMATDYMGGEAVLKVEIERVSAGLRGERLKPM